MDAETLQLLIEYIDCVGDYSQAKVLQRDQGEYRRMSDAEAALRKHVAELAKET